MSSWVSRLSGALAFLCISFGIAHAQNTFLRNDGTFAQIQVGDVNGGASFPTPTRAGDIIYWNGSIWTNLPGNNSGTKILQETSSGVPSWASLAAPTYTTLTSGSSATYTPPAGVTRIRVRMIGGGGGGGAASTNVGTAGNTTSFGSWTANGGGGGAIGGGAGGSGGSGGSDGTGTKIVRLAGGAGGSGMFGTAATVIQGGIGGNNPFGGAGSGAGGNAAGNNAAANTGAGGQGGGAPTSGSSGAGGGAGEYVEFIVPSPSATTYTVGASANGGAAGGKAGGNGAAGLILIEEFYY